MKNWRGPLLAMLLFAVLVAVAVWGIPARETPPDDQPFGELRLTNYDYRELQAVSLQWLDRDELRIVAEDRDDGTRHYQMVAPIERPTDQSMAELLFKSAARVWVSRLLTGDEEEEAPDPAEFGFDDPDGRLTITLTSGEEVVILVGDESPLWTDNDEQDRYVLREGTQEVYLMAGIGWEFYVRPVEGWRDAVLLRLREMDVQRMDIEVHGESWAVERTDDVYGWRLASPHRFQASPNVVENFFWHLDRTKAEEFVEDEPTPAQLEEWQLNDPWLTVAFTGVSGQVETIEFGAQVDETAEHFYARKQGLPHVYRVRSEVLGAKGLNHFSDWAALQVFEFTQTGYVREMELEWQGNRQLFVRNDDHHWTGQFGAEPRELPRSAVQNAIRELLALRAYDLRVDADDFGFDRPQGSIRLVYQNPDQTEAKEMTVTFGRTESIGNSGSTRTYARVEGLEAVLLLEDVDPLWESFGALENLPE